MSLSHDESPLERPIPSPASNTPINPEPPGAGPRQPRVLLPLLLFAITCWTTTRVGTEVVGNGLMYSVPLLTILVCHEFGHYLQARRYGVPASLPYFIPLPSPPLGTMGAVIGMRGDSWNRKELFDIGISGPLAGLVPALIFSVIGLQQSTVVAGHARGELMLGAPLLFRWLIQAIWGTLPPEGGIELHPMAYAGWVGVFITGTQPDPDQPARRRTRAIRVAAAHELPRDFDAVGAGHWRHAPDAKLPVGADALPAGADRPQSSADGR